MHLLEVEKDFQKFDYLNTWQMDLQEAKKDFLDFDLFNTWHLHLLEVEKYERCDEKRYETDWVSGEVNFMGVVVRMQRKKLRLSETCIK